MRRNKGQSILEYVIVLTVIVAAIAFAAKSALNNGITGAFQNAGDTINGSTKKMADIAKE